MRSANVFEGRIVRSDYIAPMNGTKISMTGVKVDGLSFGDESGGKSVSDLLRVQGDTSHDNETLPTVKWVRNFIDESLFIPPTLPIATAVRVGSESGTRTVVGNNGIVMYPGEESSGRGITSDIDGKMYVFGSSMEISAPTGLNMDTDTKLVMTNNLDSTSAGVGSLVSSGGASFAKTVRTGALHSTEGNFSQGITVDEGLEIMRTGKTATGELYVDEALNEFCISEPVSNKINMLSAIKVSDDILYVYKTLIITDAVTPLNDLALPDGCCISVNNASTGSRTITGFSSSTAKDGRVVTIVYSRYGMGTAPTLVLSHDDALSSAANRILCVGAADLTLTPDPVAVVKMIYNSSISRWIVM